MVLAIGPVLGPTCSTELTSRHGLREGKSSRAFLCPWAGLSIAGVVQLAPAYSGPTRELGTSREPWNPKSGLASHNSYGPLLPPTLLAERPPGGPLLGGSPSSQASLFPPQPHHFPRRPSSPPLPLSAFPEENNHPLTPCAVAAAAATAIPMCVFSSLP